MKNILNHKKCLENLSVLSEEIEDVRIFLESFYGEEFSKEKCQTCDEASVGLSVYHYLLNQIKSRETENILKMYKIFGDDLLVIIDGGLLSKEDIVANDIKFKKIKLPSFWFSIKSFCNSILGNIFKSLKNRDGFFADEKTQKQRLAICKTCTKYQDGKCVLCTCPMNRKVKLKHESCADKDNKKW